MINKAKIMTLLKKGEGLQIEFKECRQGLSRDIFPTVCSFLNRLGGEILLGVDDNGRLAGVENCLIEQIQKDFISSLNNPQKIAPSFYLSIEEIEIKGKKILYIYVPQSSQVHRCNNRIYDRNKDSDLDITDNTDLVMAMYLKKKISYSENKVYPFLGMDDFRKDLFVRVRKMAANRIANHPWGVMDERELLKSSQLFLKDYQSGKEGFSLAAALLFGKDEVILSILPHFRTDAILRKENLDRYDDRDDIRTNLIESYDRIMAFTAKHLPDKFYLENEQNINIRDRIFREIASNILIHREYLNPFPAKLVIEKTRVYTENSNKPHGHGLIDPNNFSPFPKNPVIARFFKEIGWAEELGSGVRNLFKYGKIYSGVAPQLIEEDIFKIVIPFTDHDTDHDTDQIKALISVVDGEMSRDELQSRLKLKHRKNFRDLYLNPAIKSGLVELTIPTKPRSKNQKYRLTQKGQRLRKMDR